MTNTTLNTRAAAARVCWQIIDKGQSLDAALASELDARNDSPSDRGFIQEIVYGVCRWYGDLNLVSKKLLDKPIRNKDRVLHFVLLVGLYQLRHLNTADHAAVAETVSACKQLNKRWATKLINGCLRSYQRLTDSNDPVASDKPEHEINHPDWLSSAIVNAWPDHAADILRANDTRPPMCLRVNRRHLSREEYADLLNADGISAQIDHQSPDGVILDTPVGVDQLPKFADGFVSVQDTAAQLACYIAKPVSGEKVLDACAAPGGKTAHLLEFSNNEIALDAMDISQTRGRKISETLARLNLKASVMCADARNLKEWSQPTNGYDLVLIDAPCSGTGVIRRHPDIKHHRTYDDIEQLAKIQQQLLNELWQCVKSGGRLLYMTCSILPEENMQQIETFLAEHKTARLAEINHPSAIQTPYGRQALQGVHNMDGFFYSLLVKDN